MIKIIPMIKIGICNENIINKDGGYIMKNAIWTVKKIINNNNSLKTTPKKYANNTYCIVLGVL